MNHQDVKTPRPRSKDTGLYEQSNRGHRVIRLPFEESAYTEIVDDPELFRAYVDDYLTKFAELLPDSMQLSNGKKIKYLFGGRDLLLRSGIFCVRSSATGNKNNETSVTKVIS